MAEGRRRSPSIAARRTALRPSVPNSRPMPDCLKPPNGLLKSIVVHVDAEGAGANRGGDCRPCSASAVQTDRPGRSRCRWRCGPRPARRRSGITSSTGPKISSCAMRMWLSASANTVGWTYQPLVVRAVRRRRRRRVAPSHGRARCRPRRAPAGARRRAGPISVAGSAGRRPASPDIIVRERVDDLVVALADRGCGSARRTPARCSSGRPNLRSCDGAVEVGVVEDDRGGLAAELEAAPA